ncbi:Hypothetical protein R9X50_00387000 [Acrodontium crateriforme]|uniref:Uncharacterized protein n=1 Tax=Acrodontium crateriforme TaxID=150365 RepID=A0AAQ3R9S2_9PEZI|nr:Hypothetical protein R9X50_00387000 [Acrodontium crateriforme]
MDQRPTSSGSRPRTFSFRSDKSAGSKHKVSLVESPKEKQRRDSIWKNTSKANPNNAISEAQPGAAALLENTTLQPLRDLEHRDAGGNLIADPDLSNPTRPRLERPLDTIRSFEKAIDDGYKRRSSYRTGNMNRAIVDSPCAVTADSLLILDSNEQNNQYNSRRSSYVGEYSTPPSNRRPIANRSSTAYENTPSPARYSQNGGGYYGNRQGQEGYNGPPRMRYNNRVQSEGGNHNARQHPQHGYHQSQNTMNTDMTSGSDSTGPWANYTDPSSENSSIDKLNAINKADSGYGMNAYGSPNHFEGPIMEEQGSGSYGGAYPPNRYGGGLAAPPVQSPHQQRRPIALGGSEDAYAPPRSKLPTSSRPEPEKRKSWLSRRFSKKA